MSKLLTFPDHGAMVLSVRAKALVFNDPKSQLLLDQLERLAPTDATVLIAGDTGTGKELVARHIHERSGRSGPFLAVNCGALTESLVEAELFGHEAGAFTGATQARAGWFEAASGGTLFLDEIGDLPLSLQVKLLRVLQEHQVVRIGSRRVTAVDARLVAATNVDLARAVEAGHFRRDLYYRLNVAAVELPPLCQRPGDILPLAAHFAEVYRVRLKRDPVTIAMDAEAALLAYAWPGNIRELENVVHHALIVGSGDIIQAGDLRISTPIAQPLLHASVPVPTSADTPVTTDLLQTALQTLFDTGQADLYEFVERTLVEAAYDYCGGNQVRTARQLGITRNVLRAKLKKFGLLPPPRREQPNSRDGAN